MNIRPVFVAAILIGFSSTSVHAFEMNKRQQGLGGMMTQLAQAAPNSKRQGAENCSRKAALHAGKIEKNFVKYYNISKCMADKNMAVGYHGVAYCARTGRCGHPKNRQLAIQLYIKAANMGFGASARTLRKWQVKEAQNWAAEERKRAEEKKIVAKKKAAAAKEAKVLSVWKSYSSREKTLPESVLNYTSIGEAEGIAEIFWVADKKNSCFLTAYGSELENLLNIGAMRKAIDVRKINQTAHRISHENIKLNDYVASAWYYVIKSGSDVYFRIGAKLLDPSRLRKAWSLLFKECPGKKSKF